MSIYIYVHIRISYNVSATHNDVYAVDAIRLLTSCIQGLPFIACTWPRGVTVSTLDSESSDRGSNPREAFFTNIRHFSAALSLLPSSRFAARV